jgi:hypothetical protein
MYTADDRQRLHRAAMPVKTFGPAPYKPDANEPDSGVRHNPPEKYSIDSRNSKITAEISIGVIFRREWSSRVCGPAFAVTKESNREP